MNTHVIFFQEIINIYPAINPPALTAHQSNRVCNALALLQCVASHQDTRSAFLLAHIPLYLYPFLHTVSKTRPFEYLRLTSLGVIGALVKTDEQEVINFLLTTEIIPLCLRYVYRFPLSLIPIFPRKLFVCLFKTSFPFLYKLGI